MDNELEPKCFVCLHPESDHTDHDSEIGTFKQGQCMCVGCECKKFEAAE